MFSQAHFRRQSSPWPQHQDTHLTPRRRGPATSGYPREALRGTTDKAATRGFWLLPRWRDMGAHQERKTTNPESAGKKAWVRLWRARGLPRAERAAARDRTELSGPSPCTHFFQRLRPAAAAAPRAARAGSPAPPRTRLWALSRPVPPPQRPQPQSPRPLSGPAGRLGTSRPRSLAARPGSAALPPPLPLLRTGRAPRPAEGRGGRGSGRLRSRGERLCRGRRPRSQGRMEAEGRLPGLPFPAGGEGPGADLHLAAGALGTARGPLLAAAEVLALDDEEDDLEVFSKVRQRPPRVPPHWGRPAGLAGTLPRRAPGEPGWGGTGRAGPAPPRAAIAASARPPLARTVLPGASGAPWRAGLPEGTGLTGGSARRRPHSRVASRARSAELLLRTSSASRDFAYLKCAL